MRTLAAALALAATAATAHAESLPPGALELLGGAVSGTGADAKRLGFGWQLGASAAWQPMKVDRTWGWTVRWSVLFAAMYDGTAEQVNPPLRTVMLDATTGIRYRPWSSPTRYLTARVGAAMFRSNDPISDSTRDYVGPMIALGLDQYLGSLIVGVDVRYGLVPAPLVNDGPTQISMVLRLGVAGP